MRIECAQLKLLSAIRVSEKMTSRTPTLPVLVCFLFEAKKDNTLTIRATNLDLGIEVVVPAKVEEEGVIAIPANIVNSFVSSFASDDVVSIESSNEATGGVIIKTKSTTGTLKVMPHEDFPNIPKIQPGDGKEFTIFSGDFVKGLKSVWYSASVAGIKPELSSVYIYSHDNSIVFVATDSFRLAEKKIQPKKFDDFGQILIPFKNIPEIIRTLESVEDDVHVVFNKNQISFSHRSFYLVSRVVDGIFPDYRQIIPKEAKTEVIVLKQDLVNALKISHIFSDKFNQVNFKIDGQMKSVEIKTKNNDVGETTQKIDASINGEPIEINFNHKYIMDCFQSIPTDSVTLNFGGTNKPLVVKPVSDPSFTYLVMPMNR